MKFPNFNGGAYEMASLPISAQKCINWFPETPDFSGASTDKVLQPSAGYIEAFIIDDPDLPEGSFTRKMYTTSKGLGSNPELGGSIVVVVGPFIYWISKDNEGEWQWQRIGEPISNLTSTVDMVDDGKGLIIVDSISMYRLDILTLDFISIDTLSSVQPTKVECISDYTVMVGTDSTDSTPLNKFFFSYPGDNSSWDILDVQQASKSSDPITGLIANDTYLYTFGPNSYEQYTVSGDSRRPFTIAYASSGTVGLYAPDSLCKLGNSIYMIGSAVTGQVAAYKGTGITMEAISKIPLEQLWARNTTSDCSTWVDSYEGHDFIYFNFDSLDRTFCYDPGEQAWSERASRNPLTDTLHRWDLNYVTHRFGETICGDRFSNTFYLVGAQYTTENGNNIFRQRVSPTVIGAQKMLKFLRMTVNMVTGNGISNEDSLGRFMDAPLMMYRYSHDYGRTWSAIKRVSIGATGVYELITVAKHLGMARSLVFDFRVTDPCNTAVLGAEINLGGQNGR